MTNYDTFKISLIQKKRNFLFDKIPEQFNTLEKRSDR